MHLSVTRMISSLLTLDVPKTYYQTIIYPSIIYGITIWGGTLLQSQYHKHIHSLHRKILQILFSSKLKTNNCLEIQNQLGILNIIDSYKYLVCNTVFVVLRNRNVPFIYENLSSLVFNHHYNTRSNNMTFKVPMGGSIIKFNFLYQAIKEWNALLPPELKNSVSPANFKRKLLSFNLESYAQVFYSPITNKRSLPDKQACSTAV